MQSFRLWPAARGNDPNLVCVVLCKQLFSSDGSDKTTGSSVIDIQLLFCFYAAYFALNSTSA